MTAYAVTYTYGSGTDAGRDQHRPAHIDFLRSQFDAGHLRVSGPFADSGPDGALLIWEAGSETELREWIDQDPFYVNGLIGHREVRQWKIVFDISQSQVA